MSSDILLIRDGDGFRVLYGHLRLTTLLSESDEVFVDVKDEPGRAKVIRTPHGLRVAKDSRHLPLLKS